MKKTGLIATFALAAIGLSSGAAALTAGITHHSGDRMPDGTVYVDSIADKPLYTTAADAPGVYTFDTAHSYCSALDADGHKDWHVPTRNELSMLYNNRAAVGGFNETGSDPHGWYWSSTSEDVSNSGAWAQHFSDGFQLYSGRYSASSLRCVR